MDEDMYVIVKRVGHSPGFIISWLGLYSFHKAMAEDIARYMTRKSYDGYNKRKVSVTYTAEPEGDWIIEKAIMEIRDG